MHPMPFMFGCSTCLCFDINVCAMPGGGSPDIFIIYQRLIQDIFSNYVNVILISRIPCNYLQISMEHLNIIRHVWCHGIPWNFSNISWSAMLFNRFFLQIQCFVEFHGTFSMLPSSMEFQGIFFFFAKNVHGILWNSMTLNEFDISQNHISQYILLVFEWW